MTAGFLSPLAQAKFLALLLFLTSVLTAGLSPKALA